MAGLQPPSTSPSLANASAYFGVGQGDSNYASNILAQITRSQYADYLARFVPVENQLISYATDPTQPMQSALQAKGYVDSSFAANAGEMQRRFAAQGVRPTAAQSAAIQQQQQQQRGLAEVGAMNQAAQQTNNTQMQILGGATPNLQAIKSGGG
jgi:hypothetical protein